MTDLEYSQDGMFTRFYANTPQGEDAWREMAKESGVAAILNFEAKGVIAQIRNAGYSVAKVKKSSTTIDAILAELAFDSRPGSAYIEYIQETGAGYSEALAACNID